MLPGSWFLSIPDLGFRIQKRQKKRWVKQNLLSNLFSSHKNLKIENHFIFELGKKKANLLRIIEVFIQKIVVKLSKI